MAPCKTRRCYRKQRKTRRQRRNRTQRKNRSLVGGLTIYKVNKPVWSPKKSLVGPKNNLMPSIPNEPVVQTPVENVTKQNIPKPYTATYSFAQGTPVRVNTP